MRIEGTTPLWIAARYLLSERGDDFFRRRDRVLKTFDAEDIHDLRVSSRRMREALTLFAPCYPPRNITRLVRNIKQVTRLMGEMRNADEALLFFAAMGDELGDPCRGDLQKLVRGFEKSRGRGLKELKLGLRANASGSLRAQYLRTISSPSLYNPPTATIDLFASLSQFAGQALDARLACVMKLVPDARLDWAVEAQHLLRIAVKHYRYRTETLSMLFGAHYEEPHATLKCYQDVLGKMHDLDLFAGMVREEGFPPDTERFVLAAMAAKRADLFGTFIGMLETTPFEAIGQRIRNAV